MRKLPGLVRSGHVQDDPILSPHIRKLHQSGAAVGSLSAAIAPDSKEDDARHQEQCSIARDEG